MLHGSSLRLPLSSDVAQKQPAKYIAASARDSFCEGKSPLCWFRWLQGPPRGCGLFTFLLLLIRCVANFVSFA